MANPVRDVASRVVRAAGIVSVLGHTQRSVDQWLKHHHSAFHKWFATRPQVKARGADPAERGQATLAQEVREAISISAPLCLWIHGPGGCGKSTTAFWVAKATQNELLIPVLVNADAASYFSLEAQVAAALTPPRSRARPTLHMVEQMLRRGRVFVVCDGIDGDATMQYVRELLSRVAKEEIRYLCVTSRMGVPRDMVGVRDVPLGPLSGAEIPAFVKSYVSDAQADAVAAKLADRWGDSGISPLFATIAIQQLQAGGEAATDEFELIHEYLCELNDNAGERTLKAADFVRACQVAALGCVQKGMHSQSIGVDFLHGLLAAESSQDPFVGGDDEQRSVKFVVDALVASGVMYADTERLSHVVGFVHQPIAEHLMVAHVHKVGGRLLSSARARLAKASPGVRAAWQSWKDDERNEGRKSSAR